MRTGMSEGLRIVPDTSAVIDGILSEKIEQGEFVDAEIHVPEAVVAELEAQANRGLEIGLKGLEELKKLQKMAEDGEIYLDFTGERPSYNQIRLASDGEIDALIRESAIELDATFVTGDKVHSLVAKAKGLDVLLLRADPEKFGPLLVDQFFEPDIMSVHLKNKVPPMAKRGSIGDVKYVKIRDDPCTYDEIKAISNELLSRARSDRDSFFEISFNGASVLQIRDMRIAIANPPFSDDIEITVVRPIASMRFEDYRLSDVLKERIGAQRGILISGPPGSGKSTFASGVAVYLNDLGFVVKTMESPRDLQVPPEITQYAPLDGRLENTADVLLLVRPDYTIYDEVRKTVDFEIFADMRLAGVGMIGVVHANRAVDAIQRLIGRVELGVIPQVVDTVIFIDKGEVAKVQILEFTVKVPSGMTEADLARPVILISDLETGASEFEIYTYGEQIVVMPIGDQATRKPSWDLAEGNVKNVISDYAKGPVEVEMTSDHRALVKVKEKDLPRIIGKGGRTIGDIEKILGIHIDVREIDESKSKQDPDFGSPEPRNAGYGRQESDIIDFRPIIERTKRHLILKVPELATRDVEVYAGEEFIFTATVSRHGDIKIRVGSDVAYEILGAMDVGKPVMVRLD
ncbi:PINc/VapC family ATPase [Methanolobus sp. ZRKC3]|uniref:PINc/VapC family ATPase n=1 Tax=Methanolobus sp. ZRKC3 TaxID=3125786 RepID=UPI00324E3580